MSLWQRLGTLFLLLVVLTVGILSGIVFDRQVLVNILPAGGGNRFQLLNQAWDLMQQHYVAWDEVDQQKLIYGAVTGMVNALGDTEHSRFMSPDERAQETANLEAKYEGIGAYVDYRDGHAVIVSPIDGTPAQKAGIKPGDVILAVDGEDMTGKDLNEIIDLITGPAGTQVTLTLVTPETGDVRDVTITRAVINIRNVTWAHIPGTDYAHLRVSQFSNNVTEDLKKALTEMTDQGIKGIVLDLRSNPGGYLNEAVGVTSQFLSEGNVLIERDAQGKTKETPVEPGGVATGMPLVVLINRGSASASEITAGAIQDAGRAKLVGEKTFGTGTVLQEFPLSDGSSLLLATSEWLTPSGRVIWHEGIVPDIEVPVPLTATLLGPEAERGLSADQVKDSEDAQLLKAIEILDQTVQ